jgi:hypothetical protein
MNLDTVELTKQLVQNLRDVPVEEATELLQAIIEKLLVKVTVSTLKEAADVADVFFKEGVATGNEIMVDTAQHIRGAIMFKTMQFSQDGKSVPYDLLKEG